MDSLYSAGEEEEMPLDDGLLPGEDYPLEEEEAMRRMEKAPPRPLPAKVGAVHTDRDKTRFFFLFFLLRSSHSNLHISGKFNRCR